MDSFDIKLHLVKFTGSTSSDLGVKLISCPTGICALQTSPIAIDPNSTNAYMLLNYNSIGIFFAFDYNTGNNVGTRYLSTLIPNKYTELVIYNQQVIGLMTQNTKTFILIYDIRDDVFDRNFAFAQLMIEVKSMTLMSTGELHFLGDYVAGGASGQPYISKIYYNSVGALAYASTNIDRFNVYSSSDYLLDSTPITTSTAGTVSFTFESIISDNSKSSL